jgi:hypothetical protein
MSQRSELDWNPFLTWFIANIFGFSVLGIAILTIWGVLSRSGFYGVLLIISLPISIAQWIALRRISRVSVIWILTIPLGLILSFFWVYIFYVISVYAPNTLWDFLFLGGETTIIMFAYLIIGLLIGLPQWLILRRYYAKASFWLLGGSLGAAVGIGSVYSTDLINQSGIFSYISATLLYTILTGLALVYLLAEPNLSPASA